MPNGSLERYRPPQTTAQSGPVAQTHPTHRRAGYLLCGLLGAAVLIAGGLWLASGRAPAPSPAASAAQSPAAQSSAVTGTAGSSPAGSSAAVMSSPPILALTQPALGGCGLAAVSAACAPVPIHVSLARVPARPGARRPAAHLIAHPGQSAAAATPSATATPAGAPSGAAAGSAADQVLAVVNQARSAAGLPLLTVTAGLVASSQAHDLLMAEGCGLTHQCPGEPAIGDRETAAGVTWTEAGENIGEGGPVADTAAAMAQMAVGLTQDMLAEQPPDDGHRLNILSSTFTHIGIAVYRDSAGTVWLTQDFSG